MCRLLLITVTALTLVSTALAQTGGNYVGEIVGQDVYIRSGPDRSWYAVTQLSQPAHVQVVGAEGEWLKIAPPEGTFSLISKQHVQRDGATGTVTADQVLVRAGSLLQPGKADRVQGKFSRGATVAIIGETEEYYKIKPVGGVLYVHQNYIRPAPQGAGTVSSPTIPTSLPVAPPGGLAAVTQAPPAPPAPLRPRPAAATTQPAGTAVNTLSSARPLEAKTSTAAKAAFDAAEKQLAEEYKKPEDKRDYKGLRETYAAIALDQDSAPLKPVIEYRMKYLEWEMSRAGNRGVIEALHRQTKSEEDALESARINLRRTPLDPKPTDFTETIRGRLTASTLYTGKGFYPKRWTLRLENTGVILSYLEATGTVRLADHEGWMVAVTGRPRYNAALKTNILEVTAVERIAGGEPDSAPPTPTTMPTKPPVVEPTADWSVPAPAAAPEKPAVEPAPAPASQPATPVNAEEFN